MNEDLLPETFVGSTGAWVSMAAPLAVLLVVLVSALAARRAARRRAARVRAALWGEAGDDELVVLEGIAERAGDDESDAPLVRLAVRQAVTHTERNGKTGGKRRTWTEIGRDVAARPFELALASGERVHVEASSASRVFGELVHHAVDENTRERLVEVRAGARVFVTGELRPANRAGAGAGYRRVEARRELGAGRDGLAVWTSSPEAVHARRAVFHARWAGVAAVAVALHTWMHFDAYWLLARGETVVLESRIRGVGAPGYVSTHAEADYRGTKLEARVRADPNRNAGGDSVARLTWIVDPGWPSRHALAPFPNVATLRLGAGVLLACLVGGIFVAHARASRPWHARRRLVEVVG